MASSTSIGKSQARAVLERGMAANRAAGHENLGFLSEERGFLPLAPPERALPAAFRAWDELAWQLPELGRTLALRASIERLAPQAPQASVLPDSALVRAAHVLAMLVHGYVYAVPGQPSAAPEALTAPWAVVCQRLGRPIAAMSYVDLIVYNHRLLNPTNPDPYRIENMQLLTPAFDTQEEHVFYLTQVEILAQSTPIISCVVRAQDAILARDDAAVLVELEQIIACLTRLATHSLVKINPRRTSASYVDPVLWAKTVAPFAVPPEAGIQGPSGTASPLFGLLDSFIGRSQHESFLGKEIRSLRAMYPPLWREFLEAVEALPVIEYARRTPQLAQAFDALLEVYAGQDGFLGRHRRKVYGYLEVAFKVGRELTIGGFGGVFADRTWEQVDDELDTSRRERPQAQPSPPASHTVPGQPEGRYYEISELIYGNDAQTGLLLAIEGVIYDVTAFVKAHPGGAHTLEGYAGTDATRVFTQIHTTKDSVRKLLAMYRAGRLRMPADSAHTRGADPHSDMVKAHKCCAALAFLCVEMLNAVNLDYRYFAAADAAGQRSPYELCRAIQGQDRFFHTYLNPLLDKGFEALAKIVARLSERAPLPLARLARLRASGVWAQAAALPSTLQAAFARAQGDNVFASKLTASCRELEALNVELLTQIRADLRRMLRAFERKPLAISSLTPLTRIVKRATTYAQTLALLADGFASAS